jgi:hypothetical protein
MATDLHCCGIGDVGVRLIDGAVLEFRSASPCSVGLICQERKALAQLCRIRQVYSLSNCFVCEPSGGLSLDDDGCTVLRMLLPHASPSWVPLHSVDASIRSKVLSVVAGQLCDWHSVGVVHRTVAPNCIIVDPSPPSSASIAGPAVVLLHWACSSIFNGQSKAFTTLSNSPHRVPSYAAPERLRWKDASPISPCEDFYGLGLIVKRYVSSDKDTPAKDSFSGFPLNPEQLWKLLITSNPVSTVLDYVLQPDCLLRAFRPSALQNLILAHGSEVFASPCQSLLEQTEPETGSNDAVSGPLSPISADSTIASLYWIENCVRELVDGECIKELLVREISKLIVIGVTVQKDVLRFLRTLLHNRVLMRITPWFVYVDIDAVKQCDAFVEKSSVLMRQYDSVNPCTQVILLRMAACPYFMPIRELLGTVQV